MIALVLRDAPGTPLRPDRVRMRSQARFSSCAELGPGWLFGNPDISEQPIRKLRLIRDPPMTYVCFGLHRTEPGCRHVQYRRLWGGGQVFGACDVTFPSPGVSCP